MAIRYYKCTLLSDVILDAKSATEGQNRTLDFIPGNCFLGIVASKYTELDSKGLAMQIFHSGNVKFSDAHPSKDGVRSIHIPALFATPKIEKKPYYLQHKTELDSKEIIALQLKQCRSGFYTFKDKDAEEIGQDKTFALKSAYDREYRRSKDGQMYGYESLRPINGIDYYFTVESDNESLLEVVDSILTNGEKHIGRSRTSQYGTVSISAINFREVGCKTEQSNEHTVYADGRLIFVDEAGMPNMEPTAQDLGFGEEAHIKWEKSQVRSFQYAPWNGKRMSYDADRLGFEKGSVFVVESDSVPSERRWIGAYNNEGFGKVIYDPEVFEAKANGESIYEFSKDTINDNIQESNATDSILVAFLKKRATVNTQSSAINESANKWVKENKEAFSSVSKSQWGEIRSYASSSKTLEELGESLFVDGDGYVVHGVSRWTDNQVHIFKDVFNDLQEEGKSEQYILLFVETIARLMVL